MASAGTTTPNPTTTPTDKDTTTPSAGTTTRNPKTTPTDKDTTTPSVGTTTPNPKTTPTDKDTTTPSAGTTTPSVVTTTPITTKGTTVVTTTGTDPTETTTGLVDCNSLQTALKELHTKIEMKNVTAEEANASMLKEMGRIMQLLFKLCKTRTSTMSINMQIDF